MNYQLWDRVYITPMNPSVTYAIPAGSFLKRKLSGLIMKAAEWVFSEVSIKQNWTEIPFVLSYLSTEYNLKILDLGSSSSELPLYMRAMGHDVTAFDQDPYPFTKSVRGDIYKLSEIFSPGFDMITAVSVLEHIGIGAFGDPVHKFSYEHVLTEIKKVLKRDGRLILTIPVTSSETRIENMNRSPYFMINIYEFRRIMEMLNCTVMHGEVYVKDETLSAMWQLRHGTEEFQFGNYNAIIQFR